MKVWVFRIMKRHGGDVMSKIKCAFTDSIKAIPSAYLQDRSDRQGTFKELYDQTHDALQVDHPIKKRAIVY